jgi:hypothetical protein
MNVMRLVISTVVGAIALMALGWFIFEFLFGDYYASNMTALPGVVRDTPLYWGVGVGCLFYALLITLGLELRPRAYTLSGGLIAGGVVGLLLWGAADFTVYALMTVQNLTLTIVDPLLAIVQGAIAGAIIGVVGSLAGGRQPAPA